MKKIIIFIFVFISFLFGNITFAECDSATFKEDITNPSVFIDNCKPDNTSTLGQSNFSIESGLGMAAKNAIGKINTVVGLLGVFMIVVAGFMMQFSGGDDSKVKKAKDIIKWSLIGVVVIIGASSIVYVVINLMYSFSG